MTNILQEIEKASDILWIKESEPFTDHSGVTYPLLEDELTTLMNLVDNLQNHFKKSHVTGYIITDEVGRYVAILDYVPTEEEEKRIHAEYAAANDYAGGLFYGEKVTIRQHPA